MRRARFAAAWLAGAAWALSACAPAEEAQDAVERRAAWDRVIPQPIRPDDPVPWLDLGYEGVEPRSWDTPGGGFKIWWVEQGPHAARRADSDGDGIPDIVQDVGAVADAVGARLDEEGWRQVVSDTELTVLGGGTGGDDRFDIYLVDFGGSADGAMVRNGCQVRGSTVVCSAHFLMENDFAGYGYPSIAEAVRVLVSHEYFHAVQAAYNAELPPWFSEGTATWFEEHFNPDQEDFERLANLYFNQAGRSLDSPPRGPVDGFTYATALFFYHLELRYGWEVIREALDETRLGDGPLAALERALVAEGVEGGLIEAFGTFATWNVLTGERAVEGVGYPQAADFDAVDLVELEGGVGLNWEIEVDALTAVYARVRLDERMSLDVQALEGWPSTPRVYIVSPDAPDAPTLVRLDERGYLEGDEVYLVVIAEETFGSAAGRMALRRAPAAEPEPDNNGASANNDAANNNNAPTPDPASSGGGSDEGCAVAADAAAPPWPLALLALGLAWRARRRRARP